MGIIAYSGASEAYTFTGGTKYLVELWGAESIRSGSAGYAYALMNPSSNLTLYFYIGGSPAHSNNQFLGGWNGGGAGGSGSKYSLRGYGGGGATDLRTSTSTSSPQQYKVLVAGGSGGGTQGGVIGGGVGESGYPYPQYSWEDGSLSECGGAFATETSAGAGGLAPKVAKFTGENDSTYGVDTGGGGGGGYYGGGGGSTGAVLIANSTSAKTFTAGNAGTSAGVGGAGGSYTSTHSACGGTNAGSGGAGSDYYKDGYTNFISGTTYQRSSIRPSKPIETSHGIACVYPIYSQPEIRSILKDGNYIIVEFGKKLNNNIEERFYINNGFNIDEDEYVIGIGHGEAITLKGSESIKKKYPILNIGGEHTFTVSITNGIDNAKTTYKYKIFDSAPTIYFNEKSIPLKLIQGSILDDIFVVETILPETDYRREAVLIIDDVEYPYVFSQRIDENYIQLPYLYDGNSKQVYKLKIKARVCQTAQSLYGTGKDIWSEWIESNEMFVYAINSQFNNLVFTNDFKNRAIKKATKLNVAWEEKRRFNIEDKQYRLMIYQGDNIIQSFDTSNQFIDVVLDYPAENYYRFGLSILINGFLSEVVYSDTFYLTDVDSSGVSLSKDLILSTNIEENFKRIDVIVNDDVKIISKDNINEKLPISFFKDGINIIEIKIYVSETDFVYCKYNSYIAYNEFDLNINNIVDITSTVTINGKDSEELKLVGEDTQSLDLCIAEKEMSITGLGGEIVEEITQKITLSRVDPKSNDRLQLFEILGSVE